MRKSVLALAVTIAAACSGVALAGEVKQDQNAPAVKAQVMTDSEMDKVTAGSQHLFRHGLGLETATHNPGNANPPANGVSFPSGNGRCTAFFRGGNAGGINCI